jgi:uncharacterized protein (DUF433 family)
VSECVLSRAWADNGLQGFIAPRRSRTGAGIKRMDDRIEINLEIMMGKPVVRGTRIPVEMILRKLGEGATEAELLDAYPRLTRKDLLAAILFAADVVAHEIQTD